jgi:hypothetical protein
MAHFLEIIKILSAWRLALAYFVKINLLLRVILKT